MELKCLKYGCTAAHKNGHMKEHQRYKCKHCGYHKNYATWKTRRGQDFGFDTLFVGLVDESYGQNRRCHDAERDAVNTANLFQEILILQ